MSKTLSYQTVLERRLCFHYLMHLSQPGCLALINEKDRRVYVLGSKYPLKAVVALVDGLQRGTCTNKGLCQDKKRLQLKILGQCDSRYATISKLEWIDHYKRLGYGIYNTESLPQYRIATRVILSTGRIEVCVATQGKRWYPVQSFKTAEEAEAFIAQNTVFSLLRMIT